MRTLPFAAFVGLDDLKLALMCLAVNPQIRGLLILGPKGTGKSSIVRAFADLLPEIPIVKDCPFNCNPFDVREMCDNCRKRLEKYGKLPVEYKKMKVVELPIGATEDSVLGTIDIERTLKEGRTVFEPGLLARANRNILYIDEVNLLPDHLVDIILDAAASGWNIIEREGVSLKHPSKFILIGSMNPEEGELRPQLLDRFAICVKLHTIKDPKLRAEIIRLNLLFDENPSEVFNMFKKAQENIKHKIIHARHILPRVTIGEHILLLIAKTCSILDVDGYRPDIVTARVAKTIAALDGRTEVTIEDVSKALKLSLAHRTRAGGLKPPPEPLEIDKALREASKEMQLFSKAPPKDSIKIRKDTTHCFSFSKTAQHKIKNVKWDLLKFKFFRYIIFTIIITLLIIIALIDINLLILTLILLLLLDALLSRKKYFSDTAIIAYSSKGFIVDYSQSLPRKFPKRPIISKGVKFFKEEIDVSKLIELGITYKTLHARKYGREKIRSGGRILGHILPRKLSRDINIPASLRTAARRKRSLKVSPEDLRANLREGRAKITLIVVLDCSASMIYSLKELRKALYAIRRHVLRKRDRISLIVCKGYSAHLILHPVTNFNLFEQKLSKVGLSDFTPLASGLLEAYKLALTEKRRGYIPLIVLISDGNANVPLPKPISAFHYYSLDPAVNDLIEVAKLIAKAEIPMVVINTRHKLPLFSYTSYEILTGTEVMLKIAKTTKATYISLTE